MNPTQSTMHQPDFWQYFISLFVNVPPELKRFVASAMGTAVSFVFWTPADAKGVITQAFMSFVVSHYATGFVAAWKKIDEEGMIEGLRVFFGFGGVALFKGIAKLFKKFEGNPEKSMGLLGRLADEIEGYRRFKKAITPDADAPDQQTPGDDTSPLIDANDTHEPNPPQQP